MSIKTVYITGCLGFIGSHLTRACLNLGWYVRGVDKITYAANPELIIEFSKYKNFSFEKIDICDIDRLIDCDYIINLAAETHVDNSVRNSKEFVGSNINGVYNILELLRAYKSDRINLPTLIHISTDEVYGSISTGAHMETDILNPSNPYSATKAAADQLILAWAKTYDISYVIIRPTNNYGIGQHAEKLIPRVCKYLYLGKKIQLHNNGLPIRNWLHARDTAEAVIKVIESNVKNEIFNISGGFEQSNMVTVKKIMTEFFGKLPKDLNKYIDFSYSRTGQDMRYSLNDDKLRSLGWSPKCKFDEELPAIVNHYKKNFIW